MTLKVKKIGRDPLKRWLPVEVLSISIPMELHNISNPQKSGVSPAPEVLVLTDEPLLFLFPTTVCLLLPSEPRLVPTAGLPES